jgi:hypothetical protein
MVEDATHLMMANPDPNLPKQAIACLSLAKTSSNALTAAMKAAGFETALHLHYFGPRSIALKGAEQRARPEGPEPMLGVALKLAAALEDPEQTFRIVTCLRDPIARLVSQAFDASPVVRAHTGVDITRDPSALIAWTENRFKRDITTEWFDESFRATFGFDFRQHLFDSGRRSLRFCSERLRLLVLRIEDPAE